MASSGLWRVEIFLLVSVLLSLFSWGKRILFPFQIFTTWVHEVSHALIATLLGAQGVRIYLSPDGSGLTQFKISKSRIREVLVAGAGYVGCPIFGCLLFLLATQGKQVGMTVLGMLIFSLLFWIRNGFGWICMSLFSAALGWILYTAPLHVVVYALTALGMQTMLNAMLDIRVLLRLGKAKAVQSDAHQLQKLLWLPHWFWSLSWLSFSAMVFIFALMASSGMRWH